MSQQNPNPEEHSRIVDAALSNLQKKFRPAEPTDLDIFFKRVQDMIVTVNQQFTPILAAAMELNSSHPLYPHRAQGRQHLQTTLHKLFCDQFVHLSKDELVFMLAFVHTTMCLEKQV